MRSVFRLALICGALIPSSLFADDISTPSFDRIDYAHPEKYLELHTSFGDGNRIRDIAASLRRDTAEATLAAIAAWIDANLKYDDAAAYSWRDCLAVVDSGRYGGCADHALVFAALARACGIPTVFVKTMDADWIREFRPSGKCSGWRGHVFLEVFVKDKWSLLDAQAATLYDDYTTTSRILPRDRYAYDKGSDPRQLVLSTDWERWKLQTAAHFSKFDVELLPPGGARPLPNPDDVYIAANSPIWEAATNRCRELGHRVPLSFNNQFETNLPRAAGCRLLIACVAKRLALPDDRCQHYLPIGKDELLKRTAAGEMGVARKTLPDGTKVVLLYAGSDEQMLELVRSLQLKDDG